MTSMVVTGEGAVTPLPGSDRKVESRAVCTGESSIGGERFAKSGRNPSREIRLCKEKIIKLTLAIFLPNILSTGGCQKYRTLHIKVGQIWECQWRTLFANVQRQRATTPNAF